MQMGICLKMMLINMGNVQDIQIIEAEIRQHKCIRTSDYECIATGL